MPVRKSKAGQRQNASAPHAMPTLEEFLKERGIKSLGEIDSERERLPSSVVELTAAERKLLADPDWIDEDEADTILALRIQKKHKPGDYMDIRDYIRSRGFDVKD